MASPGTSGCAPLWRATPLSPVGQSEGSRAEDAGCPLLAGGEPAGRGLWWCLASSPAELVTSAGVETSLCTTSRRAQQCQARGPRP